jgi:Dyp-type peroxidase family
MSQFEPDLESTQGYIMLGHGRDFVRHGLIRFRVDAKEDEIRRKLAEIGSKLTSTANLKAERDSGAFNPNKVVSALGLTWPGYQRIGLGIDEKFSPEFRAGFAARAKEITGRDVQPANEWNTDKRYHALLILAAGGYKDPNKAEMLLEDGCGEFEKQLNGMATVRWIPGIIKRKPKNPTAIVSQDEDVPPQEHFGFVDGVSHPLLVSDTRNKPAALGARGSVAKPRPEIALVRELYPGVENSDSEFGSYLAFVKIEQNVEVFEEKARELACSVFETNNPSSTQCDDAKALIIGRKQNGKPLVGGTNGDNDFNESDDRDGKEWPFASHTRKMNPRQSEQSHRQIVRRGCSYEEEGGTRVGILFQCFQASLQQQFEFLFRRWANFGSQPAKGCGVDPLVGFDPQHRPQVWPGAHVPVEISGLTTIRGGEYFYFPSIPSLKHLHKGDIA